MTFQILKHLTNLMIKITLGVNETNAKTFSEQAFQNARFFS